jgi:hypothetical protein
MAKYRYGKGDGCAFILVALGLVIALGVGLAL